MDHKATDIVATIMIEAIIKAVKGGELGIAD